MFNFLKKLHNPFKYEGIEKSSFFIAWMLVIAIVLKIFYEVIGYLYDNNLFTIKQLLYGIFILMFLRVVYFVFKGK
jgi:hypothetical protein